MAGAARLTMFQSKELSSFGVPKTIGFCDLTQLGVVVRRIRLILVP